MRLLLVEDDPLLGQGINTLLTNNGYVVDWVKDGSLADQALKNESFDVVVLDLGLPKLPGINVLHKMRQRGDKTPVLILTAKDTTEDEVKGFETGADDYLTKPFDLDILSARLRALHRRTANRATPLIEYKEITIDPATHVVKKEGNVLNLPRREYALLQKLIENAGRALSREQLLQSMYGWEEEIDSNSLEVHIHNLRKKFGSEMIVTIRGIGYMVDKD